MKKKILVSQMFRTSLSEGKQHGLKTGLIDLKQDQLNNIQVYKNRVIKHGGLI